MERTHLFFVCGSDGLSLFSVHGPPGEGETAEADTDVTITGDPDGVRRTVEDDPGAAPLSPDSYDSNSPFSFGAFYWWRNGNTDGQALTGFGGSVLTDMS